MNRRSFNLGLVAVAASAMLGITGTGPAFAQSGEGVTEMSLGDPDAPVKVVEYASFTCPHCASFHSSVFKDLKKNYIDTGKVHFTYREVYFDRQGLWASMVARCGGEDRFFGIVDMIYNEQRQWTSSSDPAKIADDLRNIGRRAGLTDEQLDACLTDADEAQSLVAWFQKNSEDDNITATPSFIVDGEPQSNMSYDEFSRLIDDKIGS